LRLRVAHSGPCEIYLNGELALKRTTGERGHDDHELLPAAQGALRPGRNVVAVHASTGSNRRRAFVDVGLIELLP
jgi:hypothetical protein